jgi:Zn-dependent protease/CBS domain-containing protein
LQTSIRFGRIAGIEVGANWSWLIVVVLIAWVLAAGVFPESNPGLSDGTYVAMAAVAAVLFFSSLLLHELGHAIQAKREGMEIDTITLWIFGGVARFKGMFPSAGAELRIALAGPVVSLVLGVAFLGLASVLSLPTAVDGVVFWLGYINLILLAFNMLPALPLDGGRVLQAGLWARKRDFGAATRTAAGLGRLFGQALIAWGLLVAIFGGAIGGLWLAFIGWFLLMAADAEASMAEARDVFEDIRVRDVMARDPVTTHPDLTLREFMDDVFLMHRHTSYPVTDDGHTLGLISFRRVAAIPREEWERRHVRDCMFPLADTLVVSEDAEVNEILAELTSEEPRRALVCDGGRLLGLVSITDTARVLEALSDSGRRTARGRSPVGS